MSIKHAYTPSATSPLLRNTDHCLYEGDLVHWHTWKNEYKMLKGALQEKFNRLHSEYDAANTIKDDADRRLKQHEYLNTKFEHAMENFDALVEYFSTINLSIINILRSRTEKLKYDNVDDLTDFLHRKDISKLVPAFAQDKGAAEQELTAAVAILSHKHREIIDNFLIPEPESFIKSCKHIIRDRQKLVHLFIAKSNLNVTLESVGLQAPLALAIASEYFAHVFNNSSELSDIVDKYAGKAWQFMQVTRQIPHLIQQIRFGIPLIGQRMTTDSIPHYSNHHQIRRPSAYDK